MIPELGDPLVMSTSDQFGNLEILPDMSDRVKLNKPAHFLFFQQAFLTLHEMSRGGAL